MYIIKQMALFTSGATVAIYVVQYNEGRKTNSQLYDYDKILPQNDHQYQNMKQNSLWVHICLWPKSCMIELVDVIFLGVLFIYLFLYLKRKCRKKFSGSQQCPAKRWSNQYIVHFTRTRNINSRTKLYLSNTEKSLLYNCLGSERSTSPVRSPREEWWHHVHFSDYLSFICINICFTMHHMIAYAIENNTFGHLTIQILNNFYTIAKKQTKDLILLRSVSWYFIP